MECESCKEIKELEVDIDTYKDCLVLDPDNWVYRAKIIWIKGEIKHLKRWCDCKGEDQCQK